MNRPVIAVDRLTPFAAPAVPVAVYRFTPFFFNPYRLASPPAGRRQARQPRLPPPHPPPSLPV